MSASRVAVGVALVTLASAACQSRTVVSVQVQSVEIRPSAFTLVEGESETAQALPRGPEGEVLTGRSVVWSIDNTETATVDEGGTIAALAAGLTIVRATVEGVSGSATVTVLPGPRVQLSTESVSLAAVAGRESGVEVVDVTNGGRGVLSDLSATVAYPAGGVSGWLTAGLSGTAAPAELSVKASAVSLAPGTYQALVTVQSTSGRGSSADLTVDLDVQPAPPSIILDIQDVSFSGVVGGQVPAVQTVKVENGGGGVLSDLSASIQYAEGEPAGWLQASLANPEAPTQLTLQASVGLLSAGKYHAVVEVASSVAENSPQTVSVTFEVVAIGPTSNRAGMEGATKPSSVCEEASPQPQGTEHAS